MVSSRKMHRFCYDRVIKRIIIIRAHRTAGHHCERRVASALRRLLTIEFRLL